MGATSATLSLLFFLADLPAVVFEKSDISLSSLLSRTASDMSINALLYVLSLALLIWTGSVVTLLLLLFFCLFLLFFSLHFFCFTREHVHYTLPPKCHSLKFRFDSIPSSSLSLSPFPFLFFPRLRAVAFASPTLSFFFPI